MYRLYNEYAAMNDKGKAVANEVDHLIENLILFFPDADLNDMENVISQTVGAAMAEKRLRHASKMRREERAAAKLAAEKN